MFRKLFDWLDKEIGKSGEKWRRIIGAVPFLLFVMQLILMFAFFNSDSDVKLIALFLLNTLLVPVATCVYPFYRFAKKKYKIHAIWLPFESFSPLMVLAFYSLEVIYIVRIILRRI